MDSTAELEGVYQQIESELRSQYRISYQSSNNSPNDGFRAVRVEVAQKGMEARTTATSIAVSPGRSRNSPAAPAPC